MATKSSKIAVTLQPSLKQKLREYGKENQIKNFSGVILAILDEYFGSPGASSSDTASASDVMSLIQDLTARIEQLESGSATTSKAAPEKPKKPVAKPKVATRKTATRSSAGSKAAAAKPAKPKTATKTKTKTTSKSTKTAKPAKPTKPVKKAATKSTATKTKTKTTRTKSSSKAAPVKKAKGSSTQWMSTREAFNTYGGSLSWSRFSKLTPEELKERFNLDSDLSRKVRGSRFNQWLKAGK